MAAAIGERTVFVVQAKSTARPAEVLATSLRAPASRGGGDPFQCRAQMSVNSRRAVSLSTAIFPLSRSISTRLPSSCSVRRPMSIDWMREGGAVRMAW